MRAIRYTLAHLDAPIWDSGEEYERMHPRLLWHLHTPYAHTWCVEHHGDVIGVGAALRFGDQARLTVCKLVSGYDANAIRTLLVNAMCNGLCARGCTGITVTVAPKDQPAWKILGFTAQEQLLRYSGGGFFEGTNEQVAWLKARHRLGVMHLDRRACGFDRSALLFEHTYLGRVYQEGAGVQGFALATLGEALIIAGAPEVGLELQRWILPTQQHLLIPAGNAAAHEHLTERGYRAEVVGVRMTHGTVPSYRPELIYAEPFAAV